MIDKISQYFPSITPEQSERFNLLMRLYPEWNEKINVISRKDVENLEVHHILHSLAIAKFLPFAPGSKVLDFGSGGGFPGIPLAILFPDTHFHLVDRVGKKMRVASEIAKEAGLQNVSVQHGDIGECREKFDFVVSRAVMQQKDLVRLARKNVAAKPINAIPNGLVSLKGGDLSDEIKGLEAVTEVVPISQYFNEPFFEEKKIVYTSIQS